MLRNAKRAGASATHIKKHVIKIWQSSFYDFNIYSYRKFIEKLNYIHQNPIRAGLVEKATDYKYASAKNYYLGDDSLITVNHLDA